MPPAAYRDPDLGEIPILWGFAGGGL